ncbi:hypothetical protein ASE63_07955 [Bosea sp. Root381]|nr:hypothetical protein ASE63_07955 [Bosea sp. Root381]
MLFALGHRRLEALDRREIATHRGRMQGDDARRLFGRRQFRPQPVSLGLQGRELALQGVLFDQSLHIGSIDALVLALGRGKALLDLSPIRNRARGQTLALLVVDPDIERDRLAVGHPLAQACHDRLLDTVEIVGAPVGAATRFGRRGAADPDAAMIAILHRHAAAAGATSQQA